MPRERQAPRSAALVELEDTLGALGCVARLLSRRVGPRTGADSARDHALRAAMRRAIRRAEAALKRLPNHWSP
jgi:hypothetical protein